MACSRVCCISNLPVLSGVLGATTHSCCVEVREDPGPHLPLPCKALFHREQDDIVSPVGPLLALFPRGKKVDMVAEGTPDGLNRVHVLSARGREHEGDHRC